MMCSRMRRFLTVRFSSETLLYHALCLMTTSLTACNWEQNIVEYLLFRFQIVLQWKYGTEYTGCPCPPQDTGFRGRVMDANLPGRRTLRSPIAGTCIAETCRIGTPHLIYNQAYLSAGTCRVPHSWGEVCISAGSRGDDAWDRDMLRRPTPSRPNCPTGFATSCVATSRGRGPRICIWASGSAGSQGGAERPETL